MPQDYPRNMRSSAYRHLDAAKKLDENRRRDVAGYLYGWAAECAFKAMMLNAGIPETGERRTDPYYAHFEDLRDLFLDSQHARRAQSLRTFAARNDFMQHWHTSMRYSDGKCINDRWIDRWAQDANSIVAAMDA